ncbi:hypothetical protein [Amycolatopsis thermophila]|uniref:ABC transporter ATP-binding protein n=1 Tax=Amycolatopsis thermophila TaxID=206084 RepID=A0ABU0F434_9PSEU|nr:hypothetical protein [Amycolatopsis thermophila]MDQ0382104.1 hypothetical protein [Amycolatopsis thermophila]
MGQAPPRIRWPAPLSPGVRSRWDRPSDNATGTRAARTAPALPAVELRAVTRTYGAGHHSVRALDGVSVAFPAAS